LFKTKRFVSRKAAKPQRNSKHKSLKTCWPQRSAKRRKEAKAETDKTNRKVYGFSLRIFVPFCGSQLPPTLSVACKKPVPD
jgi:hypothetical protein